MAGSVGLRPETGDPMRAYEFEDGSVVRGVLAKEQREADAGGATSRPETEETPK